MMNSLYIMIRSYTRKTILVILRIEDCPEKEKILQTLKILSCILIYKYKNNFFFACFILKLRSVLPLRRKLFEI